jgi:hypothetical protein
MARSILAIARRLPIALAALALAAPVGAQASAWTQEPMGSTAIFHLATAPYPHPSRKYTDDRVMFFVPSGFRPQTTVDLVIHYHGHNNDIVHSDAQHHYREQLFLSKKNAILIEPQGPLNAADSGGGKHEEAGGLRRFVDEVVSVLARESVISSGTTAGQVILSGHSGAYHVMAADLARGGIEVSEVHLYDALYGESSTFESWAVGSGRKLVSTYTDGGGTAANNEALRARLAADGISVESTEDDAPLAGAQALIARTDVVHNDITHQRHRWAEVVAHSGLGDLSVPRAKLRTARAAGGQVELAWYPSRSAACRGWRVYGAPSPDGPFSLEQDETTLDALTTMTRVPADDRCWRVAAVDDLGNECEPSNVYAAHDGDARTRVLVVDGFVRTSGSWKRPDHDFAALVGRAVGGRAYDACRASAVTDGSVSLGDYASVVWLAGDQSTTDCSLTRAEQSSLASWLASGGALLLSGSELGWDLAHASALPDGRTFFAHVLHAGFVADASPSRSVTGHAAPFASSLIPFGGAMSPYRVPTPDVLAAAPGATVALRYADGGGAAIAYEGTVGGGTARSGVLTVGFPIEATDSAGARAAVLSRALTWLDEVNRRAGR